MRNRLLIVDVLVNGTGATLILFFLFIVRLNPEEAQARPATAARPILIIDIALNTPKRLDELAAVLRNKVAGQKNFLALLPPADIANENELFVTNSSLSGSGPLGLWGASRTATGVRLVAPCPSVDADWWRLALFPSATASSPSDAALDVEVALRILSAGESSLVPLGANWPAPLGQVQSLKVSAAADTSLSWKIEMDETCDE